MNARQVAQQMQYRLRARNWPGSANRVFPCVHVAEAPSGEAAATFEFPLVLIRPRDETPDSELPGLGVLSVDACLVVVVHGDLLGETAYLGANRLNATSSEGRGILDVEEQLKLTLQQMQNAEGIRIVGRRMAEQSSGVVDGLGHVLERVHRFLLTVTTAAYYHPPREVQVVNNTGGKCTITWADPPDRFDRRKVMIRRAAGATAPASWTAGTLVVEIDPAVQTYQDSPGAGQFSYALFGTYTDTGAAANESASDQEEGTTRTVVVT